MRRSIVLGTRGTTYYLVPSTGGTQYAVRRVLPSVYCTLHFRTLAFGSVWCMVSLVWCYLLPHLPVPVLPPPTVRPAERHTAYCVACMACVVRSTVAPWHLAPVCSIQYLSFCGVCRLSTRSTTATARVQGTS